MSETAELDGSVRTEGRRIAWPRALPPARCLVVALALLGAAGAYFLHGLGLDSLLTLPLLAAGIDLGLQRVRFERLRIPDAAIATGLFLALIFPPTASLLLAGAATASAIALRHALRIRGRPWLNPAASGALLGTLALGLTPAWWVAIGPWGLYILLALGGFVLARTLPAWRLPIVFVVAYALASAAVRVLTTDLVSPSVLLLGAADPMMLFFGLFMVAEPRTAPADGAGQAFYALGVAVAAAVLPVGLPTIGAIAALLVGNLAVTVARAMAGGSASPVAPAPRRRRRRRAATQPPEPWPLGYRAGLVSLVLIVLLVAAALTAPAPVPTGRGYGSGSGGPPVGGSTSPGGSNAPQVTCTSDNPSIASNVRSELHAALGPSVLLSYEPNTGLVVFYDPVNHVTVTETDLFEDYGYAEFNGDDYAVSGCHP